MRNLPRPDHRRTFQGPGRQSPSRSGRRHHRQEQSRGQGERRPQRPPRDRSNQPNPGMRRQGPPPHVSGNRQNRPQEGRENRKRHRRRRSHQDHFGPQNPMRLRMQRKNRMRHFFDRGFADGKRNPKRGRSRWNPPIEFAVYKDKFEVLVELTGVSQDSVKVSATDKLLIVKGEKQRKQTDEKHKVYRSELKYGRFRRLLPLPSNAKTDGIEANFKNGVLTIVIPKSEESKPTEIPINGNE